MANPWGRATSWKWLSSTAKWGKYLCRGKIGMCKNTSWILIEAKYSPRHDRFFRFHLEHSWFSERGLVTRGPEWVWLPCVVWTCNQFRVELLVPLCLRKQNHNFQRLKLGNVFYQILLVLRHRYIWLPKMRRCLRFQFATQENYLPYPGVWVFWHQTFAKASKCLTTVPSEGRGLFIVNGTWYQA